jgi:hypothetical protein
MNQALVVVVDSDVLSIGERKKQIESQLDANKIKPRKSDEKVLIVTPRRNIESWFAWLDEENVDETIDYKPRYKNQTKPGKYGKAMAERCRGGKPENAPDSLLDACKEIERLG